jgi:hypothetical protein
MTHQAAQLTNAVIILDIDPPVSVVLPPAQATSYRQQQIQVKVLHGWLSALLMRTEQQLLQADHQQHRCTHVASLSIQDSCHVCFNDVYVRL